MSDEQFMELAIVQARIATEKGNWPIGCVIVLGDKVIAEAHNLVYSDEDRLAHAELLAIKTAQPLIFSRPNEAILYSTYEPCPMCFGACLNARLKKVVYGVDLNESGATCLTAHLPELYKSGDYDTEFVGGVLADKCEEVYKEGEATVLNVRKSLVNETLNK